MRNLKKILALVLALVMSLSLMATASAADTTAAANDYTIASTVLQGLGVVRGDDGGIREADPITRAEVAALAYRIHTADVKDEKANLYYDLKDAAFTDLAPVQAWALGYIGYAHNAQIVKGNGDGTFNPTGNITGYEVLAMTLRAIGYGKNGEFEGAEWQINTAAWARREGLLEGVSPSDQVRLDQPASRGMVFQVLLNAIQHSDVQFSYVTPDLYVEADASMAARLGLEVDTGVVIANEWAALDATSPLAAGKTKVEVSDGTTRTLNWSAGEYQAGLEEIGKSHTLYIKGSEVLYEADSGLNDVKDNDGKEIKVSSLKGGLTVNETTQHFTNFEPKDKTYSDMRIEVRLEIAPSAIGSKTTQFKVSRATIEAAMGNPKSETASRLFYEVVIPAKDTLSPDQLTVIKEIFRVADDSDSTNFIKGEVYVGTRSIDEKDDVSNTMSYDKFDETYLTHEKATVDETGNGNWLQVIDNDTDGVAEYVLLVEYELDTIIESRSDKLYYRSLDIERYTPVEVKGYTQTLGDVVLYAVIDGNAYVHKADTANATFKAVNYKDETATDTEGTVWEQSAIANHTTLPGTLTDVDELTSYNMYLDDYGYVRAYDNKVNYALLTEMYPTAEWNSAWVVNRELTAEAMLVGDTAVREYKVVNSTYNGAPNPFFTSINGGWSYPGITNIRFNNYQYSDKLNYLQPATHMLGVAGKQDFVFDYRGHDLYVADGTDVAKDANGNPLWPNFNYNSWTNVAKYTQTSDGLNLYTAAGASNNVTTDYIRLNSSVTALNTINKNNPLFTIEDQYYDEVYTSADSHYVRAVDSTVFFLVTVSKNGTTQAIRQYTGYSNVPTLTNENNVRSMYAVAHTNTPNDVNVNARNYWVADVIVIEMYTYNAYESISLIYSNDYKNQGDVKYVEAIDSVKGEIRIIPNNYNVWNGRFEGYGFYGLNNLVAVEGETNTYTADITHITDNTLTSDLGIYNDNEYNKNGIYYGQVRSLWSEDGYSNYITLDVLDHNGIVVDTKDVRVTLGAWGIKDNDTYNSAVPLLLKSTTVNNKVETGDKVIWVETSGSGEARTAGFLIDLTDTDENLWNVSGVNKRSWNPTPAFLLTEAGRIGRAQWTGKDVDDVKFWNYEEIIGKRNDVGGQTKAAAPQDGFVIDSYNIFLGDNIEAEIPVFSGIMDDGLWHIRYNIPEGSVVNVRVDRNDLMKKDLVLNSDVLKGTVTSTKTINGLVRPGTGIDVYEFENWSFAMPVLNVNQKVIGTIFEDTTDIPANTIYGAYGSNRYTLSGAEIKVGGSVTPPEPSDDEITVMLQFQLDGEIYSKYPTPLTKKIVDGSILLEADDIYLTGETGVVQTVTGDNGESGVKQANGDWLIPAEAEDSPLTLTISFDEAGTVTPPDDDDTPGGVAGILSASGHSQTKSLESGHWVLVYVEKGKMPATVIARRPGADILTIGDVSKSELYQERVGKKCDIWKVPASIDMDKIDVDKIVLSCTWKDIEPEKPVEVPAEVRAVWSSSDNAYKFYGYGYNQNVELDEDVAKAALAAALKKDQNLDLKVEDITFDGGKAICKIAGGATKIVNITSGKNTSGSWEKTAEQYAINYGGKLLCYAYKGETVTLTGLNPGYVMSDVCGVSETNTSAVTVNDKGIAVWNNFPYTVDTNLVDYINATSDSTITAISYVSGTVSGTVKASEYVRAGSTISVTGDSLNTADGVRYQVYLNDEPVKLVTGVELAATNGVVEIGTVASANTKNGTAHFSVKQVYDVTIDGNSVGYHYSGEEIAVSDLAAGTVIMGSRDTAANDVWAGLVTVKGTDTGFYTTVQKADDSHKQPYFVMSGGMASTSHKGNTPGSIALYTANEVEFSGTSNGGIKLTNGNWSAESGGSVSSQTWYISSGTTIDLTSSAANKLFRVTKGNAYEDIGTIGDNNTTASFEINGNITIAEIDAAKSIVLVLNKGVSTVLASGDRIVEGIVTKDACYNMTSWDTTGTNSKTIDYSKCEIVAKNGHEDVFVSDGDYIVTLIGLKPATDSTFAQLTGIALANGDGSATYEIVKGPVITQNNDADGTVNITFTFKF